jgi:hypothetical protein
MIERRHGAEPNVERAKSLAKELVAKASVKDDVLEGAKNLHERVSNLMMQLCPDDFIGLMRMNPKPNDTVCDETAVADVGGVVIMMTAPEDIAFARIVRREITNLLK